MFCTQCQTELPDGSQFCSKCGTALARPGSVLKGRRSNKVFLTFAVGGVLIIAALVVSHVVVNRGRQNMVVAQQMAAMPVVRSASILDSAFTVKNASYAAYRFDLPAAATHVWIDGQFSAAGGSGNDIEVYLLDADGFVNWTNHHSVQSLYNSGRLTQSKIFARLPDHSGTYYLVFNNAFSLLSPKAIQASVTLHYNT